MYEYEAEIRFELTEETFEHIMGREVKDEEDWRKFVDCMIDAAYDHQEDLLQGNVKVPFSTYDDNPLNDDWKVV